jgi:hypothetical protein
MVAEMLLHEPAPVAIWVALWLATVPAMVVLASPAGVRNPGRALLDACTFLIGRWLRPPAVAEAGPAGFLRPGATSAKYAADAAFAYATFAAEAPAGEEPFPYVDTTSADAATPITAPVSTASTPAVGVVSADVVSAVSRHFSSAAPLTDFVSADAALHAASFSADVAPAGPIVASTATAVSADAAPLPAVPEAAAPCTADAGGDISSFAGVSADAGSGEVGSGQAPSRTYGFANRAPAQRSLLGRFLHRAARRRVEGLRRVTEAIRTVRYAEEVRLAAEQAGYAADCWQEHWETASERVDVAFRAWLAADSRVRRSRAATAFGTPATGQSPAEYADRERFLHLAVRAAAERGELPTSAVADALTGRGGWEARLHPVDQELVIQRASAAHLEAVWKRAVEAEALAWHDAQAARRSWQSLCQQSILAGAQAAAAHHLLPPEPILVPATITHSAPVARVA